jgi:5'-3' exonuclease
VSALGGCHATPSGYSRRAVKLHLVDGTYELFRAFFSRPAQHAPDGRPVNAVSGLIDSLLSLLREPDVTHVGVATDHVIASWRNDVYAGYKTDAGVPPALLAQFEEAERAVRALGLVCWAMVEDEADDAIATAVARWADAPQVEQVVICTPDKDMAQLVRDGRVVLRDRMRRITYDEAAVVAKFGVPPASIPDYLALVGDAADGYPGLPGWGAKSAASVLSRFGSLDDIPTDLSAWPRGLRGAPLLSRTLIARRPEALLYRHLARLRHDSDIGDGSLDGLEWRGVPRDEFLALCDELGLRGARDRPHRWRHD